LWESTAVPEIRDQVAELATLLLSALGLGGELVESSIRAALPFGGNTFVSRRD
jgi:hypothetical protein